MFPPPAASDIDWNRLGIAVNDKVNGHVESHYSIETGKWSDPQFVTDPYLKVHGLSPGLNYGQQAYEGMKAFRGVNGGIGIFRPATHAARLANSSAHVSIPPIPEKHFLDCVKHCVARNAEFVPPASSEALLYIRPLVFGSSGHLALTAPASYTFAIYVQPGTTYHGVQPLDAIVLEDFDRAAPRGTGGAKIGGNYAPVIRWSDKARAQGFGVTLHLDAQTREFVEEFSTSGFVGVSKQGNDITLVVPDSDNIVPSVTSDSCLTLAESWGWKVERRPIRWSEVASFDEVVAVGTAASLLPIKSILRKSTNEKFEFGAQVGECTARLGTQLRSLMKGNTEDVFGWLDRVDEGDLLGVKVIEIDNSATKGINDTVIEVKVVA